MSHDDHRQSPGPANGTPEGRKRRLALADDARAETPSPAAGMTRRAWMELTTGAAAMAALAGCDRDPIQKILPYTVDTPDAVPGTTHHYATSTSIDGYAFGLLVESHEGRPTKIEGNPAHPASLGATGLVEQASILGLYDPHRARAIRGEGAGTWDGFAERFGQERSDGGAGLRFLVEPNSSPLIAGLIARVKARHPQARFTYHGALGTGPEEGARLAFGAPMRSYCDLRKARVIVAFDSNFTVEGPDAVRLAREFADGRRVTRPGAPMNRLYVVEPALTPTGSVADHRLRRRAGDIARIAGAILANVVLEQGKRPPRAPPRLLTALAGMRAEEVDAAFVRAVARDLTAAGSGAAILVGHRQPADVHAIAHLLSAALESDAERLLEPVIAPDENALSLADLTDEIRLRRVDTLVVLNANPAYTAPADLEFTRVTSGVRTVVHLSLYDNETSRLATWLIPAAHFLESWGDTRASDGTLSIVQPLISPIFNGRTTAEVLAVFAGLPKQSAYDLVRAAWADARAGEKRGAPWESALRDGVVAGTAAAPQRKKLAPGALADVIERTAARPPASPGALEIAFALDAKVFDGRYADNPWLLELPEPMTKLSWENAASISPATAARFGLTTGDEVLLGLEGRSLRAPVLVAPGHADDAVTVTLGYGREGGGPLAREIGFAAGVLRTSHAPWFAPDLRLRPLRVSRALAISQEHTGPDTRDTARSIRAADYERHPDFAAESRGPVPTLLRPNPTGGEQWAMSIDMTVCTGCSACMVACQSENNVAVVGKENVRLGRMMYWLRIDTYFDGTAEDPAPINQPMACQHCEKAPCEYVCPVNATVHSPDGLNEMVYNRCVGTRFCSNNCPYKVRRFNWFNWNHSQSANQGLIELAHNPEVTVRDRGVMEKCSYCVQRIRGAEIRARVAGRPIAEGEVVTACMQACPTHAITFGSLSGASEVVRWRAQPRSYGVLHELGTEPRTQYLARVMNPNPELE